MGDVGGAFGLACLASGCSQDAFPAQDLTCLSDRIIDTLSLHHVRTASYSGYIRDLRREPDLLGELEPLSLHFFAICLEKAV